MNNELLSELLEELTALAPQWELRHNPAHFNVQTYATEDRYIVRGPSDHWGRYWAVEDSPAAAVAQAILWLRRQKEARETKERV